MAHAGRCFCICFLRISEEILEKKIWKDLWRNHGKIWRFVGEVSSGILGELQEDSAGQSEELLGETLMEFSEKFLEDSF